VNIKKRIYLMTILGLLLVLSSGIQAKDSLSFAGAGKDAGQLDPHLSTKSHDKILFTMMFNALVQFKPGSMDPRDIEPDLATSWETSDDNLTWTFFLRKSH